MGRSHALPGVAAGGAALGVGMGAVTLQHVLRVLTDPDKLTQRMQEYHIRGGRQDIVD